MSESSALPPGRSSRQTFIHPGRAAGTALPAAGGQAAGSLARAQPLATCPRWALLALGESSFLLTPGLPSATRRRPIPRAHALSQKKHQNGSPDRVVPSRYCFRDPSCGNWKEYESPASPAIPARGACLPDISGFALDTLGNEFRLGCVLLCIFGK